MGSFLIILIWRPRRLRSVCMGLTISGRLTMSFRGVVAMIVVSAMIAHRRVGRKVGRSGEGPRAALAIPRALASIVPWASRRTWGTCATAINIKWFPVQKHTCAKKSCSIMATPNDSSTIRCAVASNWPTPPAATNQHRFQTLYPTFRSEITSETWGNHPQHCRWKTNCLRQKMPRAIKKAKSKHRWV